MTTIATATRTDHAATDHAATDHAATDHAGTAVRRLFPVLLTATVLALAPASEATASIGAGITKDQLSTRTSEIVRDLSADSRINDTEPTVEPRPERTLRPRPTRTLKPLRPIRPGHTLRPGPPLRTPDGSSASSTGCDVAASAASCATVVADPTFTG
jgi:hypothetical protein